MRTAGPAGSVTSPIAEILTARPAFSSSPASMARTLSGVGAGPGRSATAICPYLSAKDTPSAVLARPALWNFQREALRQSVDDEHLTVRNVARRIFFRGEGLFLGDRWRQDQRRQPERKKHRERQRCATASLDCNDVHGVAPRVANSF